jgi:hypothetical protein
MKNERIGKGKKTIAILSTNDKAKRRSEEDSNGYLKQNCNIKSDSVIKTMGGGNWGGRRKGDKEKEKKTGGT